MKKRSLSFLCVVSFLNVSRAFADDGCAGDPNNFSQRQAAECEDNRYRKADAALNAVYKDRIRETGENKEKHDALVLSERQWIVRRDKACKDKMDSYGVIGLTYATANAGCLADEKNERVKVLQSGRN